MLISPLQLSAFWVGKVFIEPAAQPIASDAQITVDTVPAFRRDNDDTRNWIVDLRVQFRSADKRRIAYEGSVEMTGVFRITGDFSEAKQLEVVGVNAPSILYSSIRDFVAMLTAHGPNGKMVLPSVSFLDQKLLPPTVETESAQTRVDA